MSEEISTDPLMGTIERGGAVSETPPDVDDFLNEAGLTDKLYVCTIKRAPMSGSGAKEFLPGALKGTYLPIEDCGKRFGPGQYFYCFAWSGRDPETNKPKKMFKEYKIYLGSEWDDIHDEYQAEKWATREKKIVKTAQQKKMQDAARGILPDNEKSTGDDPIENLKKTMGIMKDIGVPIGGGDIAKSDNSNVQMMGLMMQIQSEASKSQMNMFMQMNTNMMQMFGMMMKGNNSNNPNEMFKEIIGMVQNTVDLKAVLNPEKQGVVDKIFNLAESVFPAIMEIAKKPIEQRRQDPLVNVVKDSPDFNKMANDPEMLKEAIRKWDEAHGASDTDAILETVGLKRPGEVGATEEAQSTEYTEIDPEKTDVNGDSIED